MTLPLSADASLAPALSPRGGDVRVWRAEELACGQARAQADEAQERKWAAEVEQLTQKRLAGEARWRELEAELGWHARQFDRSWEVFGDVVITQCNAAIAEVWARLKPLHPSGPNRGQPRDLPFLSVCEGVVWLKVGKYGQRIQTPVLHLPRYGERLAPHWKYEAWAEGAVPALGAVIERFVRQLPDAAELMAAPAHARADAASEARADVAAATSGREAS